MIAEINGNKLSVTIYSDEDYLGRFDLDDQGNLIQFYPMSNERKVIGRLFQEKGK